MKKSIPKTPQYKFDIGQGKLACFISSSNLKQLETSSKKTSTTQLRSSISSWSDFSTPRYSKISQPSSDFSYRVLLPKYQDHELHIWTDDDFDFENQGKSSTSLNVQDEEDTERNQNQFEDYIVASCVKVLTDQKDSQKREFKNNYKSQPLILGQSLGADKFTITPHLIQKDGRTTVMVRNIPNKYTSDLLIELFQKNYSNKYNYFYLPVDHKNYCNMGYAFINFLEPKFIYQFYREFHNQKWKLFNSEKICQVCYARIQGASQLNSFELKRREFS